MFLNKKNEEEFGHAVYNNNFKSKVYYSLSIP